MYCKLPGSSLCKETRLKWSESPEAGLRLPACWLRARHCTTRSPYGESCPPATRWGGNFYHSHFTDKKTKHKEVKLPKVTQLISDRAQIRVQSQVLQALRHLPLSSPGRAKCNYSTLFHARKDTWTTLPWQQHKALSLFLRDSKVACQSDRGRICTQACLILKLYSFYCTMLLYRHWLS